MLQQLISRQHKTVLDQNNQPAWHHIVLCALKILPYPLWLMMALPTTRLTQCLPLPHYACHHEISTHIKKNQSLWPLYSLTSSTSTVFYPTLPPTTISYCLLHSRSCKSLQITPFVFLQSYSLNTMSCLPFTYYGIPIPTTCRGSTIL